MLRELPSVSVLKSKADQAVGHRDALVRQKAENKAEVKTLTNEEALLTLVAQLIRTLADAEVHEGLEAVTKLQTEGLQEIFDDKDLSLEAEVKDHRGKVSVDLITVDRKPDGVVIKGNAIESFGGSVTTVESVLLRIIVIMRRGYRPLLMLDETLGAIAKVYTDRMASFLKALCNRMPGGMDILVVSHDPLLIDAAEHAYVVEVESDGVAAIRERRK